MSISDHLPNFALLGDAEVNLSKGPWYTLRRDTGMKNKEKFRKWVAIWGQKFSPGTDSVVEDVNEFRNELRDEYNKCFPLKRVRVHDLDIRKP